MTIARHAEAIHTWRDVFKYVQASDLFSFLFFNQEKASLSMIKNMFGRSGDGAEANA